MIVTYRKEGSKPALVLIHGSDGEVRPLWPLAQFEYDRPVFGIRSQAFDGSRLPILSVEGLASHYIDEFNNAGITGPIALLGYSFGGLVAFEIARQLERRSSPPVFLGLLDTWVSSRLGGFDASHSFFIIATRRWRNFRRHLRTALKGPERRRWFRETVVSKFLIRVYREFLDRGRNIPPMLVNVNDLNIMTGLRYIPGAYNGDLTLFLARDEWRDERIGTLGGWDGIASGKVDLELLPGTHRDLVLANAEAVARIVSNRLQA